MAIQGRRGPYSQFDPTKLSEAEWATVTSGDPNAADGAAVYHCFSPGKVKRMATYEDMVQNIEQASGDMIDAAIAEAIGDALTECEKAATNANNTINTTMAAAVQAQNAAEKANTSEAAATTAATNALSAADKANAAAEKALAAAGGAGAPQVVRATLSAGSWDYTPTGPYYVQQLNLNGLAAFETGKTYAVQINVDWSSLGSGAPHQLGEYCNYNIVPCSIPENSGVLNILASQEPTYDIPIVILVWNA